PVLETHLAYLRREALIGGYEAQEEAQHRLDAVYAATARLVGGSGPDEVALFENATRAFDMALYAVPLAAGDVILTSTAEYHSMFVTYLHRARGGVRVEVVPPDATGQLDVGALRKRLDARVRLIAMTHMPTNGGLVQPAEAVGEVAREAGIFFLLDATQTVGQIPLDVRRRTRVAAVPGVSVRDLGVVRGGIVSFTVRGVDAARVKAALRAASINVTVSPARGTLLDMRARGLSEVLRASVHYYNTDEEI